jgi:hypothetical protein
MQGNLATIEIIWRINSLSYRLTDRSDYKKLKTILDGLRFRAYTEQAF